MSTPKEAFEAAKVLWPGVSHVYKRSDMTSMLCQNGRVSLVIDAEVEWGNSTEYPPPPVEWRDAVIHCEDGVATACIAAAADTIEKLQDKLAIHEASKAAIMKLLGYPPLGSWEAVYEFVRDHRPEWMKP